MSAQATNNIFTTSVDALMALVARVSNLITGSRRRLDRIHEYYRTTNLNMPESTRLLFIQQTSNEVEYTTRSSLLESILAQAGIKTSMNVWPYILGGTVVIAATYASYLWFRGKEIDMQLFDKKVAAAEKGLNINNWPEVLAKGLPFIAIAAIGFYFVTKKN